MFCEIPEPQPQKTLQLDVQGLEDKVLADCDAWRVDPLLVKVRRSLESENSLASKAAWTTMLLVYALGIEQDPFDMVQEAMESPNSHMWSFCKDKWVPRRSTVHCELCGNCYDNAWHCETCETCKAGRHLACDGCGGYSKSGVWDGEEGQKAPDAQQAQRGRSTISPNKRDRQVSLETWNDTIGEVSALLQLPPTNTTNVPALTYTTEDSGHCSQRHRNPLLQLQRPLHHKTMHMPPMGRNLQARLQMPQRNLQQSLSRPKCRLRSPASWTTCITREPMLWKFEKVDFRHPWNQNLPKSTVKSLESRLLADAAFFETSDDLRDWRDKLDTLAAGSEEREKHMQWLFRTGLSIEVGNKYFYSFCLKIWTDDDNHRHCAACKRCCSIKVSLHCGVCRQCRHDGLDVTCYHCGGRSLTATSRQEKEYEFFRKEMGADGDSEGTHLFFSAGRLPLLP